MLHLLNRWRYELLASGVPVVHRCASAAPARYAADRAQYTLAVLRPEMRLAVFTVSRNRKVVWFKLNDCYYRECVEFGSSIHVTAFTHATIHTTATPSPFVLLPAA